MNADISPGLQGQKPVRRMVAVRLTGDRLAFWKMEELRT